MVAGRGRGKTGAQTRVAGARLLRQQSRPVRTRLDRVPRPPEQGPPRARGRKGAADDRGRPGAGRCRREGRRLLLLTAVIDKIATAFGPGCVTIVGSTDLAARQLAADRL